MSSAKNNNYTPASKEKNHKTQVRNVQKSQVSNVIPDEVERRDGPGGQ